MKIIITGGAGFIGCNAAAYFCKRGYQIVLIDNLSRRGSRWNLDRLKSMWNPRFEHVDICDVPALDACLAAHKDAGGVLHLAAQTAVTTSVESPRHDFNVNLLGTFNVLEAMRRHIPHAKLVSACTNKVYGSLDAVPIAEEPSRYSFSILKNGIDETCPVDFHSPYGCSKGAAEQYVRDYGRIYGLRTVSLRQSCIYGECQFGVEDQGWVAWFIIAALLGRSISIFGNGKQTRDLLFVDDLVRLYELCFTSDKLPTGFIANVGGGYHNSLSLLELLAFLKSRGLQITHQFANTRPGDQPLFISNNALLAETLGWHPEIDTQTGIGRLIKWASNNIAAIRQVLG